MKKKHLLFFLFFSFSNLFAQNFKVESKIKGDLNKDSLEDLIVISQNTMDSIASYRIEIFFAKPDKSLKLMLTSDKAIEPQFPDGRKFGDTGNGFSDVTINKGTFSINYELIRGHIEYKFRYQNNAFELIGYTSGNSDGQGKMYSTDFNLSTGIRIDKVENYETDKIISSKKKKIKLSPLPNLKDFNGVEDQPYLYN